MSLLSGVGMTVCMIGLAVYLQLVPNGSETALNNRELSNIPLVLLLVYVVRPSVCNARCPDSSLLDPLLLIPFRPTGGGGDWLPHAAVGDVG
jgi:hypothetical protein